MPPLDPISMSTLDNQSRADISGVLLTHQLATLESIGHKHGAREAMGRILKDLLSVYDTNWAPIRRAWVLVIVLGVLWRDGRSEGDADVDQVGREALELLASEVGAIPVSRRLLMHGEW